MASPPAAQHRCLDRAGRARFSLLCESVSKAGFHYYHLLQVGWDLGTTVARELLRDHFGRQGGAWVPEPPKFAAVQKMAQVAAIHSLCDS